MHEQEPPVWRPRPETVDDERRARRFRASGGPYAEVRWFYMRAHESVLEPEGVPPSWRAAARQIQSWLDRLLTFQRGALRLRFTPRHESPLLEARFAGWTSLVVRLECARHSSETHRDVAVVEAEAAARLEDGIRHRRGGRLRTQLEEHAWEHVREALHAYTVVRAGAPCALPASATKGVP